MVVVSVALNNLMGTYKSKWPLLYKHMLFSKTQMRGFNFGEDSLHILLPVLLAASILVRLTCNYSINPRIAGDHLPYISSGDLKQLYCKEVYILLISRKRDDSTKKLIMYNGIISA